MLQIIQSFHRSVSSDSVIFTLLMITGFALVVYGTIRLEIGQHTKKLRTKIYSATLWFTGTSMIFICDFLGSPYAPMRYHWLFGFSGFR